MLTTFVSRSVALLLFLVLLPTVFCQRDPAASRPRRLRNAADGHVMDYNVYLTPRDPDGLAERMLHVAQGKGSEPWMTREELKRYVAPPQEVREAIADKLKRAGAHQIDVNPLGTVLRVRSTLDIASHVFAEHIHDRRSQGHERAPRRTDPNHSLPRDIAAFIQNVPALRRHPKRHSSAQPVHSGKRSTKSTSFGRRDGGAEKLSDPAQCNKAKHWTTACLRALYGLGDAKGSPSDAGIAVLSGSPADVSEEDFQRMMSEARPDIKDYKPSVIAGEGTRIAFNGSDGTPSDEVALDTQIAGPLIAPMPLKVFLVDFDRDDIDTLMPLYHTLLDMSDEERPAVVSISLEASELAWSEQDAQTHCHLVQQLTALGTTVVASSGDEGISCSDDDPRVSTGFPASCPYVVAVGGTMGHPEEVWTQENAGFYYSSGGGFSTRFPRPPYQDAAVKSFLDTIGNFDEGKFNRDGRGLPDLSAMGVDIPYYFDGSLTYGGGTSSAAPIVASLLAYVNSARKAAGQPPIGWIHPVIYQQAEAFEDITKGANSANCDGPKGFSAVKGWDAATGLGSIKFPQLLAAFGVA